MADHRDQANSYAPDPRQLLKAARAAMDAGECAFAIVKAQTACELALRQRLEVQIGRDPKTIEKIVAAPMEPLFSRSFSAATGLEIRAEPFWDSFCKSVKKRNGIVHQGEPATLAEARQALKAAKALLAFVECELDEEIEAPAGYSDTTAEFALILRSLLESRGMTQKELAKRSKLSEQAISRLLCGKHSPTLTTISRIAAVLGCKADVRMIDQTLRE